MPYPYPGRRAQQLLEDLAWLQYMTSKQATRLRYGNSYERTTEAFKKLVDYNYAKYVLLPPLDKSAGGNTKVHTLTKTGIAYLAEYGIESYENKIEHYENLAHALGITDLLISACLLCKPGGRFHLIDALHERVLNQRLAPYRNSAIPDAYMNIQIADHTEPIFAEIDKGTQSEAQWSKKVLGLITAAMHPYQEAFGITQLTFAVLTTRKGDRLQRLREWTYKTMQQQNLLAYQDAFLFTDVPPDSDPHVLFTEPVWYVMYENAPVRLLPEPKNG